MPKDHLLVRLNEAVPWQRFTYELVKYYRGKTEEGRPVYDLALLLKMLLEMSRLVEQDLEQGLPVKVVAADRAHDDARNHYMPKVKGIDSAIRLND